VAKRKQQPKQPKPDKPKRGRGRPRKVLDAAEVEKLIALGHSVGGAGAILHCAANTLRHNFLPSIKQGRKIRKSNLQARQFSAAMDGNAALLIWLGRQWLRQKDRTEQDVTTHRGEPGDDFRIAGKSRAEILQDLIERLKGETAEQQEQPGGEPGPEPQEVETFRGNGHQQVGNNGAANRGG